MLESAVEGFPLIQAGMERESRECVEGLQVWGLEVWLPKTIT
jgi:hypothetical protein